MVSVTGSNAEKKLLYVLAGVIPLSFSRLCHADKNISAPDEGQRGLWV